MEKKVVALLTGRGNNTLKDKNILDCLGHPILYYPANAVRHAKTVSAWYCSSDDEKILQEAEKLGYTRIKRPAELALPTSQHVDCIKHALGIIGENGGMPDVLIVILANNVSIKSEWVDICVKMMLDDPTLSAVVPVYEDNDHHPLRAKTVDEKGHLKMYEQDINGNVSTNRQDLPTCLFLAHNFWILNVPQMIENNFKGQQPWEFMGNNIAYYLIDNPIDIHKDIDLLLAEDWIEKNYTDFDGGERINMTEKRAKKDYQINTTVSKFLGGGI